MKYYDKLIFELSKPGRCGFSLPEAAQQQLPFGNLASKLACSPTPCTPTRCPDKSDY